MAALAIPPSIRGPREFTSPQQRARETAALLGLNGAIACVMDDVLSVAAGLILKWGEIAPTLEMKVSYLTQGGPGRHFAEARVLKRGRTINFLDATLSHESGRVVATATATIMIAPMKKKAGG
jgi:uncharacterized protein (TIGR00369 family)